MTSAGDRFLREAAEGADYFHRALQRFASVTRGNRGELRIGLFFSLASGFLADVVEQYTSFYTGIDLLFEESAVQDSINKVVGGYLDVAFVTGSLEVKGCETLELWQERIYVALPSKHPLAVNAELTWNDIREERFIISSGGHGPIIQDFLITRLSRIGFHPDIRPQGVGRENLMNLVGRGFGLTLTSASVVETIFPGVVFRPIAGDDEMVPCCALWSNGNSNPALRHFLAGARAAARRSGYTASYTL